MSRSPEQIERLLDAVELIKDDRRGEAFHLLRALIAEDSDFEDAWLWMSMAVDSLDQSAVCLENVLRVNPGNSHAAGALYRLREPERDAEKRRDTYRSLHDITSTLLWLIVAATLCGVAGTYAGAYTLAVEVLP